MIFITNHLQDNQPRCGCAIIVSDLSLSLRDKDRLKDWEIERAWQFVILLYLSVYDIFF